MPTFSEVFEDVTRQGRKLQTSEYKEQGKFVIIDQGQNNIAGYTNETDGLFTDVPAIVFGDHTRVLKYVDTPCFLGADGVKLLKAKIENPNYRYLFYALSHADIPDTGYNRHFKWLKEVNINLPSKQRQHEIVTVLDKVSDLISLRKHQLAKLDDLVKARFVEMFGDPVRNPMQWDTYPLEECLERIDNGKSFICSDKPRTDNNPAILKLSAATYGDYRPHENKALLDESLFVESAEVHAGDLLFTRKNTPELVGMAAYVQNTPSKLMMPDLIFRLVPNEKVNAVFLWQLINCKEFRPVIQAISSGSAKSMSNISKERLSKIKVICPPRELQDSLIPFVKQTEKSKLTVQQSLDKLETLKKALMQEYFW